MPIISFLSFSTAVYPMKHKFDVLRNIYVVVCNIFQFGEAKIQSSGEGFSLYNFGKFLAKLYVLAFDLLFGNDSE